MAISGDYAQPVQVNGFNCRNCTDVEYAKKHIDPDHPASGPFDVNAAQDPTRHGDAVKLGGSLSRIQPLERASAVDGNYADVVPRPGKIFDLAA